MWFGGMITTSINWWFSVIYPPVIPPHQGGLLGRADLLQRPRPHEGDVQSDRNDHDWVRGFDWLNR